MGWPFFLPNQLIVGNPKSNVAVVCGWTRRDKMQKGLEKVDPKAMEKIAAIGNLYTAQRGVDILVRNILARPNINTIVFCGRDMSKASASAAAFFTMHDYETQIHKTESGAEYYSSAASPDVKIWANIPQDTVELMRRRITVVRPMDDSPSTIMGVVGNYLGKGEPLFPLRMVYDPPKPDPEIFPSQDNVQPIYVDSIGEGWLELLHYILTFGKRVHTHYDQETLEIMNLVMVIENQDPGAYKCFVPEYFPFDGKDVEEYVVELMSPEKKAEVSYTYGNMMRSHFGVDQMSAVAQKIAKDTSTRSAVISLWDPAKTTKGSPCLNHLWFRVLDCRLHMTATIRSNDMFFGWPKNAYGLRDLQDWMRQTVMKYMGSFCEDGRLGLGDLVINSQSAHLYEDCWDPAKEIVDKHRNPDMRWDPKGQWVFAKIGNREIEAKLMSPSGETLVVIKGTPDKVRRKIWRRGLVSDIGHALYVGQMLERSLSEEG